jgi:RNA polymerase sigma-70 factor (ECF subfamily)
MEPHESAEAPAERGELHRELLAALATLPAEQRAALVLVDMQGYPVAEAAAVLDVPTGTVKSRCARGRARLLPLLTHLRLDAAGSGDHGRGRNRTEGTSVTETGPEQSGGGHR